MVDETVVQGPEVIEIPAAESPTPAAGGDRPQRCPIGIVPMEKFLAEDDPKKCRPCMLGPVVSWYADELKQQGQEGLADHLVEMATTEDPLTIGKEMDSIKAAVEAPLRERLEDFDCAIQSYEPGPET